MAQEAEDKQAMDTQMAQEAEAKQAMESFLAALGVSVVLDLPAREGAVYLKFNTLKGAWYLDDYSGPSRGMLITFHTSDPEVAEVGGTYGPFPVDLFRASAPALAEAST